jgi:hypothetical protein
MKGSIGNNQEQTEVKNAPFQSDYDRGSHDAILEVLDRVEEEGQRRVKDGLNEINFTIGVLNCLLIISVFAAFPQHFWILYILEALVLLPMKFLDLWRAKPLCSVFYLLDYCWCINYVGVVGLVLLICFSWSQDVHKIFLFAAYGTACGPLLGACGALPFVALVFHDVSVMTDVFIHIFPPMLVYTLVWQKDKILLAWPDTFDLDYDINFFPTADSTSSVLGSTLLLYFIWLIPYVVWMTTRGIDLPKRGYDTVFHSTLRKGLCTVIGSVIWGRPEEVSKKQIMNDDFEKRDLYIYFFGHFVLSVGAFLFIAYPCFKSKIIYGVILTSMTVISVYKGALRYRYYSTDMYANIIRKYSAAGTKEKSIDGRQDHEEDSKNESTLLLA